MFNISKKNPSFDAMLAGIGARAKEAAATLGRAEPGQRTRMLEIAAGKLAAREGNILAANANDVRGAEGQLSAALIDRLTLTPPRIKSIAAGLMAIAGQPDPVGRALEEWTRPNGLKITRVATPIGVIGMIYEARPNVTAEASAIALRAGNAIILRCGSHSYESSAALAAVMREALREAGLPEDAVQLVPTTDRAAVGALLKLADCVDLIVPRGGRDLVERVEGESRIPLLRQYEGVCHVYLHAGADLKMAASVVHNAKLRRTSICGAAECLLIDHAVLDVVGATVVRDLLNSGCAVRGDEAVQKLDTRVAPAAPQDWGREFLDSIIAARAVDGLDEALEHIRRHGSGHTDAIITHDEAAAKRFCEGLDSAILAVNASTQFADGGEFGFGGELGIATGKLHARGPIGAAQLCSYKYILNGNGQVRP